MIEYLMKHPDKILEPFLEHVMMVGITMVLSVCVAAALSVLLMRFRHLNQWLIGLFSMIYCIPSLALFAILIPFMGLGMKTAVFVLVLYNQFYLVRSIDTGFREIDKKVLEAAKGIGMTAFQRFLWVQLPLALPTILSGIRLAAISTVSIATIAATISAGGLGSLLFEGLRIRNYVKIGWGVLLSVGLNLILDMLLIRLQRLSEKKAKGL